MLLVVCVVFVIFLYLGVTAWAWIRYDEPRVVTYKDSEQALNSLISDLKRSRRTAEVIAERCNLDLAPADLIEKLISVLRERHQAGVSISLKVYCSPAPAPLVKLQEEGVITISYLNEPPPYAARIIDSKRVSKFLGMNPGLYPVGPSIEAHNAPGFAFNVANLLA